MRLTNDHFKKLYELHSQSVYLRIKAEVNEVETALDLTSTVFERALSQRGTFRGHSLRGARAWIYGIADRVIHEHLRARIMDRNRLEELNRELLIDHAAAGEQSVEILRLETFLPQAFDQINAEYRTAIELRYFDGRTYPEIATTLDVSEEVARQRVSRGLAKLRSVIGKLSEGVTS